MHFGISEYMRVEASSPPQTCTTISHRSNNNTGTSTNIQEAQQVVTKCSTSTGSNNNTGTSTNTTHRHNRLVTKCAKAVQVTKKAYT